MWGQAKQHANRKDNTGTEKALQQEGEHGEQERQNGNRKDNMVTEKDIQIGFDGEGFFLSGKHPGVIRVNNDDDDNEEGAANATELNVNSPPGTRSSSNFLRLSLS